MRECSITSGKCERRRKSSRNCIQSICTWKSTNLLLRLHVIILLLIGQAFHEKSYWLYWGNLCNLDAFRFCLLHCKYRYYCIYSLPFRHKMGDCILSWMYFHYSSDSGNCYSRMGLYLEICRCITSKEWKLSRSCICTKSSTNLG